MSSKNISLNVEGMTCNNCALGITKKLQKMGLEEVNSNFSTGEVTFQDSTAVPEAEIVDAIHSLGFQVVEEPQDEQKGLSKIEWKFYGSLVCTTPLFFTMFMPSTWVFHNPYVQLALCLPVVLLGIEHFGRSAWGSLRNGMANMDVLIFIGFMAAFGYSLAGIFLYNDPAMIHKHMFFETAATIISLVLLGNVLEHRSVNQTTTALRALTKLQKVKAKVVEQHGDNEHIKEIEAGHVKKNDIIVLNTGDQIPADGIIISGEGSLDESMISGESLPVFKKLEDGVIGGTIVVDGQLRMKAQRVGQDTVLSKIIRMVKDAQNDKPPIQQLGDKVSAIFVPVVVSIATATFLISWLAFDITVQNALMSSIAVLVISCPCAMGLATPTAVIAGIGRGAKKGILIKGGSTLESFAGVKNVVFDKTGTLTTGEFELQQLHVEQGFSEDEVRNIIFTLEQNSSHPIATSMVKALADKAQAVVLSDVKEIRGKGLSAKTADGAEWKLGSSKFTSTPAGKAGQLHLTKNGELAATLTIGDTVKDDAKLLITWLNNQGINTILLSGDRTENVEALANELGITELYAEHLPDQKLAVIDELCKKGKTAMVGDGINDAPALAKADVGISLSDATQVAIHSAQIVLLKAKDLKTIGDAFLISKHTLITIKQNLFWAFAYNVVAIPIAAMGFLNPMVAALAMAFSDVIVIGNSIRLKTKKLK